MDECVYNMPSSHLRNLIQSQYFVLFGNGFLLCNQIYIFLREA